MVKNIGTVIPQNRVKQFREDKEPHMSQWKLANKIGVSQALITIWESGYKEPTAEQKVYVAKALGSSVEYLFPEDKPE